MNVSNGLPIWEVSISEQFVIDGVTQSQLAPEIDLSRENTLTQLVPDTDLSIEDTHDFTNLAIHWHL